MQGSRRAHAPPVAPVPVVRVRRRRRQLRGARRQQRSDTWSYAPTSYVYRWQSCDAAAANCTAIGADDADFVLTSAERGRRIRATVTATNSFGSASRSSDPTAVIAQ